MQNERPISILPAIKCSTCGAEIEISLMGEHTCTPLEKVTAPSPLGKTTSPPPLMEGTKPPSGPGKVGRMPARSVSQGAGATDVDRIAPKVQRPAPPCIDPAAANKPYVQGDLLRPSSRGVSAGRSLTPRSGSRAPLSPMMRSMTSPIPPLNRSHSPELSSNLDCAFPPFPKSRPTTSSRPRSKSRSTEKPSAVLAGGSSLSVEPSSYFGPRSPHTTAGADVMQKMNTIAPGPFDARARHVSSERYRSKELKSPLPAQRGSGTSEQTSLEPAGATVPSPIAAPIPSAPPTNREGRPVPPRPARPEPLDGFIAMLKSENEGSSPTASFKPGPRSNTFPLQGVSKSGSDAEASPIVRRPSAPAPRTQEQKLMPQTQQAHDDEAQAKQISMRTPPVPALPPLSCVQQQQPNMQGVHASSDSASSASSIRSYGRSSFRSGTSTPVSAASSVSMVSSNLDGALYDQDSSLLVPNLQIRGKPSLSQLRSSEAVQNLGAARLGSSEKDTMQESSPVYGQSESWEALSPASPFAQHHEHPESPVVPAFPIPPNRRPRDNIHGGQVAKDPETLLKPASSESMAEKKPVSRPPAKRSGAVAKYTCRGCNEPITGKSVKAADGRLTGRYHKQCFVCKTCRSAFATADFYVINNDPYCEQHYHRLNNSLCSSCDCGIEGPYLETQQKQKFHPKCFTCRDCRKVLSDDYFEINDRVYCEPHAFAALRRQEGLGPRRYMERRTTRLMMM